MFSIGNKGFKSDSYRTFVPLLRIGNYNAFIHQRNKARIAAGCSAREQHNNTIRSGCG